MNRLNRLEANSIKTLADVSDKIYDDTYRPPALQDNDISTWAGKQSETPYINSPTPNQGQTPNMLIKTNIKRDDPYTVIQKYESLHIKQSQDKVNHMIEKSLKSYSENRKKLDSLNSTASKNFVFPAISEVSSPKESLSSRRYSSQSTENSISYKRKSVFKIKEELTQYLIEIVAKEKERRTNETLKKVMNESKLRETRENLVKRKDARRKLKRKYILFENGLEEIKKANEYPRQHGTCRDLKSRLKNSFIEESDAQEGFEDRFKLPPIANFKVKTPAASKRVRIVNLNISL